MNEYIGSISRSITNLRSRGMSCTLSVRSEAAVITESQHCPLCLLTTSICSELETDGELSCTFHNPTFSELFTLSSDGLLFQYPLEPLPGSKDDETDVSSTVQNVQQVNVVASCMQVFTLRAWC